MLSYASSGIVLENGRNSTDNDLQVHCGGYSIGCSIGYFDLLIDNNPQLMGLQLRNHLISIICNIYDNLLQINEILWNVFNVNDIIIKCSNRNTYYCLFQRQSTARLNMFFMF